MPHSLYFATKNLMNNKISKHFTRDEFKCNCSHQCIQSREPTIDCDLIKMLEAVRKYFDKPVNITSGHRCSKYNSEVGGVKHSFHLLGRAADIQVKDIAPVEVYKFLNLAYPEVGGIGKYNSFTHVDSRCYKARWIGIDG